MQSLEEGNLVFVRLFSGEDLLKSLEKTAKKHKMRSAVVLTGVGMLKDFRLGYFRGKKYGYLEQFFDGPHELCSLEGNILKQGAKYYAHLHATLANDIDEVVGGHLFKAKVHVTSEIVLMKSEAKLKRKMDKEFGVKSLYLQ